ncbi:unnamed protein product, partial [Rotaria sp. Silwood2]
MNKCDTLHVSAVQRCGLISDVFTQEASVWYINEQDQMPTFNSFIKNVFQYSINKERNQGQPIPCITSPDHAKQQESIDVKDSIIDSLRNQMIMINLENLPKFTVQPSASNNTYYKANYKNNELSQQPLPVTTNQDQYNHDIPKPPYQCYKWGANDHYIRNCSHFQSSNRRKM